MGYLEKLRNEAKAADIVGIVACGFLCLFLFDLLLKFLDIDVFRHDDICYISSYDSKLEKEGRWVNWLFFSMLRLADGKLVACASFLCFAVFSWSVFRNFLDCASATLATLVCLFSPPIHLLNEWALTSFMTFVLLALAGLLHDKMRMPLFFLVFGVLFNGVLSHFYFLLPLLFLGTLQGRHTTSPPPVKIFTWWILGFIIGFACAELATLVCTGKFIHLDTSRNPHYIHSLSDLVDNMRRAAIYFYRDLRFLSTPTKLLCIAAIFHAGWKWFKGDRHAPWVLLLFLFVATSAYAQTIPAGIRIQLRSAACFFLAIIALLFFVFRDHKPILIACAILVALPLYMHNVNNIEFRGSIMSVWKTDLEKIPVVPQNVNGIVLISSEDEVKQHVNALKCRFKVKPSSSSTLGQPGRWFPVAYEAGFRNIYYGPKALHRLSLAPSKVDSFERCGIYEYTVQDNWLLVRFVQ